MCHRRTTKPANRTTRQTWPNTQLTQATSRRRRKNKGRTKQNKTSKTFLPPFLRDTRLGPRGGAFSPWGPGAPTTTAKRPSGRRKSTIDHSALSVRDILVRRDNPTTLLYSVSADFVSTLTSGGEPLATRYWYIQEHTSTTITKVSSVHAQRE